jgi:hypothetical protein
VTTPFSGVFSLVFNGTTYESTAIGTSTACTVLHSFCSDWNSTYFFFLIQMSKNKNKKPNFKSG